MSLGLAMHQFATVARGTKYSKKWRNVANGLQPKNGCMQRFSPLCLKNLIVMVFISSLARHPIT